MNADCGMETVLLNFITGSISATYEYAPVYFILFLNHHRIM